MSTVNESATILMHIVNDILDFSKIEAGKLALEITNTDIYELTKQVVDLFKWQATNNKIDLELNYAVSHYIQADARRLKQILVNLLSYTLKYTNTRKISLDISESPSFSKDSFTINFSLKDPDVVTKDGKKNIFRSFYKMITRQVIDMEVLA
jgi:signal transduction histidine kinase